MLRRLTLGLVDPLFTGSKSSVADAAGPETLSFEEVLRLLASAIGVRTRLAYTLPWVGLALAQLGSAC